MAYTLALDGTGEAKEIALIRDEIDDVSASTAQGGGTEGKDYFVSDERILARLSNIEAASDASAGEKRLLTCASILDTLATNQAYVLKKKRTLADEVDGPAVAAGIRAHARALEKRAANALRERRESFASAATKNSEPCGGAIELRPIF